MRLLVCGGAGFIGSTFVRLRVREHGDQVTVLDKLTYARRRENLRDVSSRIRFVHGAIEDSESVQKAVSGCDAIVNFAAETHVDRSIADPEAFIVTNMQGTHVLLEAARERGLLGRNAKIGRARRQPRAYRFMAGDNSEIGIP